MSKNYQLSQVFVAGGQPSYTYIDRQISQNQTTLATRIRQYLSAGHKALTVTGPTKSGKTVLCRKVVPKTEGIWVEGGDIQNDEDFWLQIAAQLGVSSLESTTSNLSKSITKNKQITADASFLHLLSGGGKSGIETVKKEDKAKTLVSATSFRRATINSLQEKALPLVIDDFHYIDRETQKKIIRSLKAPIFDGLRVILIAIPHRAFDAVRGEREMTGRVDQLSINLWTHEELRAIPEQGGPLLNVNFISDNLKNFAEQAQGSPHLMQEFCSRICQINNVISTLHSRKTLELNNYSDFFLEIAASTSKPAFDLLARGPRQRTDRKVRKFKNGKSGDIYLALLYALSNGGAKSKMTYEEIRAAVRNVLAEDVLQANEISRVLVQMSTIAREKIDGEPVLEWDEVQYELHIADPFFAFYLRWLPNQNLSSET